MHPTDAVSPRDRIKEGSLRVLYISEDKGWSVATMLWRDGHSDKVYEEATGFRWNGDINDPKDLGMPSAHGHGTWIICPGLIGDLIMAALVFGPGSSK